MWKENSACRQQSSGHFGCHKHKAAAAAADEEEEESGKLELVLPIVVTFCKL
jgi:hypothetical protein